MSFIFSTLVFAFPSQRLLPMWNEAKTFYDAEKYELASERLETWIKANRKARVFSSNAHYNLALSYWGDRNPSKSAVHLYESILLNTNYGQQIQDLSVATQIQNQIHSRFQHRNIVQDSIYFLLNADRILFFFCLGLWAGLIFWLSNYSTNGLRRFAPVGLGVSVGLVALTLIGWVHNQHLYSLGVLFEKEGNRVTLYRSPLLSEQEKLTDIPSGLLVQTGQRNKNFIFVKSPLLGWIPIEHLHLLRFPDQVLS